MKQFYLTKIDNYSIKSYFKPGMFLCKSDLDILLNDLIIIKQNSNSPDIGIFSKSYDIDFFLKNIIISVIYFDELPIGFYYHFIYNHPTVNVIHKGLVIITKNVGLDLLGLVGMVLANIAYINLGEYYFSAITYIPKIIESISENTNDLWPQPLLNNQRPPQKIYTDLFNYCVKEYQKFFLDINETMLINDKKFKVKILKDSKECSVNFDNVSLANNFNYNFFMFMWLDYKSGELLFPIGRYLDNSFNKNNYILKNKFNIDLK